MMRYEVLFWKSPTVWVRIGGTNDIIEAYRWVRYMKHAGFAGSDANSVVLVDVENKLYQNCREDFITHSSRSWEPFDPPDQPYESYFPQTVNELNVLRG